VLRQSTQLSSPTFTASSTHDGYPLDVSKMYVEIPLRRSSIATTQGPAIGPFVEA
jgi:hypothetical protein